MSPSETPQKTAFTTTRWSMVMLAGERDRTGSARALADLCQASRQRRDDAPLARWGLTPGDIGEAVDTDHDEMTHRNDARLKMSWWIYILPAFVGALVGFCVGYINCRIIIWYHRRLGSKPPLVAPLDTPIRWGMFCAVALSLALTASMLLIALTR